MFDYDRWQEIFIAIKKNKLRSVLTAFGVFWAVFMLVVMVGSGNGLNNGVSEGVKDFATNSGFMWAQTTTKSFLGYARGRNWNINNDDIITIKDQVKEIQDLSPRLEGASSGENVVYGKIAANYGVIGDYPSYGKLDPSTMPFGRYINEEDIRLKRKVCIIGERVHETLFKKDEDPSGKYIRVNGVYFMVVGVVRSNNPNINFGRNKKEMVTIPFTTMQQTFNFGNDVHYFGILTKPGFTVESVMAKIKPILQKNHKLNPEDNDAIGNFDVQSLVKMFEYVNIGIALLIWIVGIGTLIAGAVGVGNIMLIIVKERTKEMGIMRAIGASPRVIITQVLTESVFLTTISGFLGLALGTLLLSGIDMAIDASRKAAPVDEGSFFLNPGVGWELALTSMILLIIIGFFAGLVPAIMAVRIKPIEALRAD